MNYNPCVSTNRISPDSWCKKSESKGAMVPPADFLLEKDLRGTPPKSEKATAFWRVGGAERGVQPFLQKEKDESNIDCHDSTTNLTQSFRHIERSEVSKSRESNQVQNAMTQERMGESHRFAQSKKIVGDSRIAEMDSSLHGSRRFAQNDEFMDYHE